MECRSLQAPSANAIASSRTGPLEKPFLHGQVLQLPNSARRYRFVGKARPLELRALASDSTRMSSVTTEAIPSNLDKKDEGLVFVAGATGKVGSRTVRELLKSGYRVRAGVRSAERAVALVQSVKQMKFEGDDTKEGFRPVEKLEVVECDLEKPDQISSALANASVVICCIGASEKEVFDVTGPYRIDYMATKNLIDAATLAKVNHFIMVSSLGTNKVGFPAAILNLFWGVLIWKRKAEEALIASGIPYTIVRPGGMERPTDAYKETHNVTLSEEDTLFGGQVSNLQVAELMAVMAKNRGLSYCKVVEVIAETTAPLTPMEELLARIRSQRQEPHEPDASDDSSPAPSNVITSVPPNTPVVEEISKSKAVATRPLSPYPTYDELKPPSSPSPKPSGPKTVPLVISKTDEVLTPVAGGNDVAVERSTVVESYRSPYYVYEGLKPPTSPCPTIPITQPPSSVSVDVSGNGAPQPQPLMTNNPKDGEEHEERKLGPLSPYTAYEDLKPPTSPMPSPKNC